MLYDVLTYTCESTERFAAELHKYEQLLQKTGTTRFEVIDLFNRTGFILSRFQSQSEMMRGQAIKVLFGKNGMLRGALLPYLAFYLPGFHPWKHDDRPLIATAEAELAQAA